LIEVKNQLVDFLEEKNARNQICTVAQEYY